MKNNLYFFLIAALICIFPFGCAKNESEIVVEIKTHVRELVKKDALKKYDGKYYDFQYEGATLLEETAEHYKFKVEGQLHIYTPKNLRTPAPRKVGKKDSYNTARYQYIVYVLRYKNAKSPNQYKQLKYKQWKIR